MRSLVALKTWINENSIEVHGIKVIAVTSVIKKIEEIEEG